MDATHVPTAMGIDQVSIGGARSAASRASRERASVNEFAEKIATARQIAEPPSPGIGRGCNSAPKSTV
jgi:hypothetical protein